MPVVLPTGGGHERIRRETERKSWAWGEFPACGTDRGRGEGGRSCDIAVGRKRGREGARDRGMKR